MNISLTAALIVSFVVLAAGNAAATTFHEATFICPIGGEQFKAMMLGSRYSQGRYLDGRPYIDHRDWRLRGIAQPPAEAPAFVPPDYGNPPPLPRCPENGLVMYGNFAPGELDILKKYIATKQYREWLPTHSHYFLAAKLMQRLGANPRRIADAYLYATWEARDLEQYRTYACEALRARNELLQQPNSDIKEWAYDHLLAGELERRLSQFGAAKGRFLRIVEKPEMRFLWERDVALHQLKLIDARDSRLHLLPN